MFSVEGLLKYFLITVVKLLASAFIGDITQGIESDHQRRHIDQMSLPLPSSQVSCAHEEVRSGPMDGDSLLRIKRCEILQFFLAA